MEADTSDASERYCSALACDRDFDFTVLYAHLAWIAKFSTQLPDIADAGGDGGPIAGNEWIGLAHGQHDQVAGVMRPGDRDMQVSGGCRCLYIDRNNM